jgi:hypothetical protein
MERVLTQALEGLLHPLALASSEGSPGLKPPRIVALYAALKGRSSTGSHADTEGLLHPLGPAPSDGSSLGGKACAENGIVTLTIKLLRNWTMLVKKKDKAQR